MGVTVGIKFDEAQAKAVLTRLGRFRDQAPKAMSTAINKTLPWVRTRIKIAAAKELVAPQRTILASMKVIKASPKNISGRIYIHKKKMNLMDFKPRQTAEGVEVRTRTSSVTFIPHGFIATMKSGHTGVFVRYGDGHRVKRTKNGKTYSSELPIKEILAPTVLDVLVEDPYILQNIRQAAGAQLMKNLSSQVDWLIAKGTAQGE